MSGSYHSLVIQAPNIIMKLIKKLYAKLSTFLFPSSKRQTKKAYKPTDINKYKNVSLTRETYVMLQKVIPRLIEEERNAKHRPIKTNKKIS